MKRILAVICAASMMIASFSFSVSALDKTESDTQLKAAYDALFSGVPGDANGDGSFTAADARDTLLYSAGMGTINTAKADLDSDGAVTAIDARMLLRVAAGLLPSDVLYPGGLKLNYFNAVINSVKANAYNIRGRTINHVDDATYDNQPLVDSFNKQVKNLGEDMDLGEAITGDKNTTTYSRTGFSNATDTNFPIIGLDTSSLLTINDVSSVEYTPGQDYTFESKSITAKPDLTVELKNLDKFVVNFGTESVTNIPDDTTTLSYGKAFDIPQKDEFMSEYAEINNMFTPDMEELLGTLRADFKYLKYYNSSITLYVDHETMKICAVEYNLHYDFSVAIIMDLHVPVVLNAKGTINVVDTETNNNAYYFKFNYESLDR